MFKKVFNWNTEVEHTASTASPSGAVLPHPSTAHSALQQQSRLPSRQLQPLQAAETEDDGEEAEASTEPEEPEDLELDNHNTGPPAGRPALLQVQPAAAYRAGSQQPTAKTATSEDTRPSPAREQPKQPARVVAKQMHMRGEQQQQQQQHGTTEELHRQLLLEAKAREELEDMLLRYERQLKAETKARQAAEGAAAEALAAMGQPAQGKQQPHQLTADLQHQQEMLQQDRVALESMRADFEAQLHTARSEVAKAQAAMSSNEAQVRAEAAAACERLAAEYESRLALLSAELERTRQELAVRTHTLAAELNRWKRHAAATASAVLEAKDEVLLRKRELDSTKDKMDVLLDKLYAGKEANSNLSGAIAAAASYQQVLPGQYYGLMQEHSSYGGLDPFVQPAPTARTGRLHQTNNTRAVQQHSKQLKQQQQHTQPHQQQRYSMQGFLLPQASGVPGGGHFMSYPSMLPWQHWQGGSMAGGVPLASIAGGAAGGQQQQARAPLPPPHIRHSAALLPQISRPQQQQQPSITEASRSTGRVAGRTGKDKEKGGSYAQPLHTGAGTASRLPRYAAGAKAVMSTAAKASSSKKPQVPDRFKEASKNVAMIAAIASRW